ncbi:hypothetical protein C9F11_06205 [Streptomyces sp. YIM 121038]|uniref:hypothetical protein n=1 Tax=Streptomyces sp. YIM 121038 TaxID=2136401 RepID=UPI00111072B6|nr:hypothetical protein [Streptomyces sp. YIM 121038]QCX74941.1 hypothetical protein C9F11_06205 [Streptomyces sp. YIM 121038]
MKSFIGMHQVVSADDYIELALGTPVELWLGVEGESRMERAARQDAARDILADHPHLVDDVARVAAEAIDAHLSELSVVPLPRPSARRGSATRAVAA